MNLLNNAVELIPNQVLTGRRLAWFNADAIRATSDTTIQHNTIVDTAGATDKALRMAAHRDGIQIITPLPFPHAQYAANLAENIVIERNVVAGFSAMQCLFCSDGLLKNIRVTSNTLYTQGQWWIALNGVLSGEFEGNIRLDTGEYAPIYLGGCRIGGNPNGAGTENIWIRSFLNSKQYFYAPVDEMVRDDHVDHVIDRRTNCGRVGDTYIDHFDLEGFLLEAKACREEGVLKRCLAFQEIAKSRGDCVAVTSGEYR